MASRTRKSDPNRLDISARVPRPHWQRGTWPTWPLTWASPALSPIYSTQPPLRRNANALVPNSPTPHEPRAHRIETTPPRGMGSTGREAEVSRADFPDGFFFGVATSAYQVRTTWSSRLPSRVASHLARGPRRHPRACRRGSFARIPRPAMPVGYSTLVRRAARCLQSVDCAPVSTR